MLAALHAVDDGVAPEAVDQAMLDFGMPMGPIELVDLVGLDVAMAAGQGLADRTAALPGRARQHFGDLGRKTGRGFTTMPAASRPGSRPAPCRPGLPSA